MALSVVILFTPASGVPSAPPGTDKVIHFGLFGVLLITGQVAFRRMGPLAVTLAGYAMLSEVLQAVLPLGRSGDLLDGLVDGAGLAAGALACWCWGRLSVFGDSLTGHDRRT